MSKPKPKVLPNTSPARPPPPSQSIDGRYVHTCAGARARTAGRARGLSMTMEAEAETAMRAAVRRLMSFGTTTRTDQETRAEAAREVGRLARSDERRKRLLAELGVVPPLVSMLDGGGGEGSAGARLAAAGALLELARGTHRNKVHIVQAGLLKKLPRLMDLLRGSHDLALLLLSITSLASTDFRLPTAHLLPFLVATLAADDVPVATKLPCLAALRNLSAKLEHVRDVACSGAVRALLALALERETAEPALSVLVALVSASAAGRKEVEEDETAPRALVEAMAAWHEGGAGTACSSQEHATYLVMVLAHGHRGLALRRRMRQLGAVQALLEVSLLGSPLARKRAAKILQWFKDEGQDRIRAHSGPRMEGASSLCHADDDVGDGDRGAKACRNAVDRIVKQSLDRNMTSILRRATSATAASVDMTNVKRLVQSSSSKSLPC